MEADNSTKLKWLRGILNDLSGYKVFFLFSEKTFKTKTTSVYSSLCRTEALITCIKDFKCGNRWKIERKSNLIDDYRPSWKPLNTFETETFSIVCMNSISTWYTHWNVVEPFDEGNNINYSLKTETKTFDIQFRQRLTINFELMTSPGDLELPPQNLQNNQSSFLSFHLQDRSARLEQEKKFSSLSSKFTEMSSEALSCFVSEIEGLCQINVSVSSIEMSMPACFLNSKWDNLQKYSFVCYYKYKVCEIDYWILS